MTDPLSVTSNQDIRTPDPLADALRLEAESMGPTCPCLHCRSYPRVGPAHPDDVKEES
jgi:hypothetical protein